MSHPAQLSLGQLATLACVMEATAPKPGNVHRSADFEDATFLDFLASAIAVGPVLERAAEVGVGQAVLTAVQQTKAICNSNTNLGTLLLLAPLAAVPSDRTASDGLQAVLDSLTAADTACVYQAIRMANPGGLGAAEQFDVAGATPDVNLVTAMRAAADRDLIARQYINGYQQILMALEWIVAGHYELGSWTDSIVQTHLRLMAQFPDSLIARKCGPEVASEAAERAASALASRLGGSAGYGSAVEDLDFWLRSDGHRRNPGTTADCIAAALFAGLREGVIYPPLL